MRLLIGIDDTDNKESRGTGFKSRQLGHLIEQVKLGHIKGITRHQLFVHDDIAYTSQNSSACLEVISDHFEKLHVFCKEYLIKEAADGSDAGLCISVWDNITEEIEIWGNRAKKEVLFLEDAIKLAHAKNIFLQGYTGTKIGQIGALAAIGLRKGGNDGRFIWLPGTKDLREFEAGIYKSSELIEILSIDQIIALDHTRIKNEAYICCDNWTRPVLKNGLVTLLVEKSKTTDYDWKTPSKDYIRANS
jgi:hypothetical protein